MYSRFLSIHRLIENLLQQGEIPLIVATHNADIIVTIVHLKQELEAEIGNRLKVTIVGGAEAHILARELANAGIGVVLTPPRPYVSYSSHLG